jgi:hypothetical protein
VYAVRLCPVKVMKTWIYIYSIEHISYTDRATSVSRAVRVTGLDNVSFPVSRAVRVTGLDTVSPPVSRAVRVTGLVTVSPPVRARYISVTGLVLCLLLSVGLSGSRDWV